MTRALLPGGQTMHVERIAVDATVFANEARGLSRFRRALEAFTLTALASEDSLTGRHRLTAGDSETKWFEENCGAYIEHLTRRKGPDADQPDRINYKRLVRA